ncbi:MAG: tetratricopeptide repeat protein 38 family protein [Acidimicrobiales bacterium]|nr:tetratricopeptide repeat protein 38 family protein [Acidimicrobiales bacterium]
MTSGELADARGFRLSTRSVESATAYSRGVELLVVSSPEATPLLRRAVESDPHFELARAALACALAAGGMPAEAPRCDCLSPACCPSTRRERQHIEIVRLVLSGERERAAVLGREHLREFPSDIVVAHLLPSRGFA